MLAQGTPAEVRAAVRRLLADTPDRKIIAFKVREATAGRQSAPSSHCTAAGRTWLGLPS